MHLLSIVRLVGETVTVTAALRPYPLRFYAISERMSDSQCTICGDVRGFYPLTIPQKMQKNPPPPMKDKDK